MRAALCVVLALVACGAVFARANDASASAVDENVSADEYDSLPFVPHQSEHDEVEVSDADEQSEVSDAESDAADALEGNSEFDGAFVQTEDEKVKTVKVKVVKAKKAKGKAKKAVRAPAALKAKPFKFHAERVRADSTRPTDPEVEKLDAALAAVKEDILATNKQITDERKWVIAVAKIIAAYNDKMKRVEAHIIALRKEMKSLYRKKKQIENLKLQKALEAKLKEAKAEHQTLLDSLKHVKVKSNELNLSGVALRNTIKGISAQLAKLRGQTVRKPKAAARGRKCGKGKRFSKKARKCVARKARAGRKANKKAAKKKF